MGADYSIPENSSIVFNESSLTSGDIVLFSGKSLFSSIIRLTQSPLKWTHIGVVVKDINTGFLYLFQSTFETNPPDCSSGQFISKTGPKLTLLKTVLDNYDGHAIAFRKLNRPSNAFHTQRKYEESFWFYFKRFFEKHGSKAYEQSYLELFNAAWSRNPSPDTSSLFCTELVAQMFMEFGLLNGNPLHSNNYNLWHFSSENTSLPLKRGYSFSPEIYYHQPFKS